jgi:GH18 family chitinase
MKPIIASLSVLISVSTLRFVSARSLGEVNANGSIDIVDALLIAQYWVGLIADSVGLANIEAETLSQYLDWINVMANDFHGGWDAATGHLANLYATPLDPGSASLSCDAAVGADRAAGVPAGEIVLDVPCYGRARGGVPAVQNGFGQQSTSSVAGSWGEAGYYDYTDIVAKAYSLFWDDDAKTLWSYSAPAGVFISHDCAQSMEIKGEYVKANGFGGVMIWELSGDRSQVLLDGIRTGLERSRSRERR